jgi:hypothetical protein
VLPRTANPVILGCWVEYSVGKQCWLTKVSPPESGPPPTAEGLMGAVVTADDAHGVVRDLYSHQRFQVGSGFLDGLKNILASSGCSSVAAGAGGPPLVFDTSWENNAQGDSVVVAVNLRGAPSAATWSTNSRNNLSPLQGKTQTSGYTYVSRGVEGQVVRFNGRHGHIHATGGPDVFFVSDDVDCGDRMLTEVVRVGTAVKFDVVIDDMKGKARKTKAVSIVPEQAQVAADGSALLGIDAATAVSAAAEAATDLNTDGAVTLCSGVSGVVSHHLGDRRLSAVAVHDREAPKDVQKWFVLAEGAIPLGSIVTLDVVEVVPSSGGRPVRIARALQRHAEVSELLEAKIIERDVHGTIATSPLANHATLNRCRAAIAHNVDDAVVPAEEDRNRNLGADRPLVAHVKHLQRYFGASAKAAAEDARVSCIVGGAAFRFDIRPDAAHDGIEVVNARCTDTLVVADVPGVVVAGSAEEVGAAAHQNWVLVPSHSSEALPLIAAEPLLAVPGMVCRVHVVRRHDGTTAALAGSPCLTRGTDASGGPTTAPSIAGPSADKTASGLLTLSGLLAPRLQGPHNDLRRLRTGVIGCVVKFVPGRTLTLLGDDGTAVHVDQTEAKKCKAAAQMLGEFNNSPPSGGATRLQAQWLSQPFTFNESVRSMDGAWLVCGARLRPHRLQAANPFLVATNVAVTCTNVPKAAGTWQPNVDADATVPVDMCLLAGRGRWDQCGLHADTAVTSDVLRHPVTGKLFALARPKE